MCSQTSCIKSIRLNYNRLPGESESEHIERVYLEFNPLIYMMSEKLYRGKTVVYPDYGEPDKVRAFFNHLIKYNEKTGKCCYQRLITCCLLPKFILNECDTGVCNLCYDKQSSTNKKRKTLLCFDKSFVIAYEERPNSIYFYSAYHISKKDRYKYM